jgi:hypothetical protein
MTEAGPDSSALLERAAVRVSSDDAFLASMFRAWCGDRLDLEEISEKLACDRAAAVHAALSRRPRTESFRADVAAIAASAGIDEHRLAALLRESASLEVFRRGVGQEVLAAARDAPDGSKEPDS